MVLHIIYFRKQLTTRQQEKFHLTLQVFFWIFMKLLKEVTVM